MKKLAESLNDDIINWINLKSVGRRYKGGLIKFEPTDLENMPISVATLDNATIGFQHFSTTQIGA